MSNLKSFLLKVIPWYSGKSWWWIGRLMFRSSNPRTVYWMGIFAIYLLLKLYCLFEKRPWMAHSNNLVAQNSISKLIGIFGQKLWREDLPELPRQRLRQRFSRFRRVKRKTSLHFFVIGFRLDLKFWFWRITTRFTLRSSPSTLSVFLRLSFLSLPLSGTVFIRTLFLFALLGTKQ